MRRREALGLIGAAAAALPFRARAQDDARIGILWPFTEEDDEGQALLATFQKGLGDLGRRGVRIDNRWDCADVDRTNAYAAELVRSSPDVIFAYFNAQLSALSRETRTTPIVFVGASDPVGAGYVESLARPGRNITGFTLYEPSLAGKWLSILKECSPAMARVALLVNPDTAILHGTYYSAAFEAAAATLGIEPITAKVFHPADVEPAIAALRQQPGSGLIVAPDTFSETNGDLIVSLAARYKVPAVFAIRRFAMRGGFMSYGPDTRDAIRRATSYVDRILRGESPAGLPVQAPIKFELIVNLDAAKAVGLTIPTTLLAQADEVVE